MPQIPALDTVSMLQFSTCPFPWTCWVNVLPLTQPPPLQRHEEIWRDVDRNRCGTNPPQFLALNSFDSWASTAGGFTPKGCAGCHQCALLSALFFFFMQVCPHVCLSVCDGYEILTQGWEQNVSFYLSGSKHPNVLSRSWTNWVV